MRKEVKLLVLKSLLAAPSSSAFVRSVFEIINTHHKKTSYAELARKMEFRSRSFVRHLIEGDKKPNLTNYRNIARGFELSAQASRYFELLIEREASGPGLSRTQNEMLEIAQKLNKQITKKMVTANRPATPNFDSWPFVYASLGEPHAGNTLETICRLAGVEKSEAEEILSVLEAQGMVSFDAATNRFIAEHTIVNFGDLGTNQFFKKHFKNSAQKAYRMAQLYFEDKNSLFYNSVFSVKRKDLPRLTQQLQHLLNDFMTEAEDAAGDELAVLNASFIPRSLDI